MTAHVTADLKPLLRAAQAIENPMASMLEGGAILEADVVQLELTLGLLRAQLARGAAIEEGGEEGDEEGDEEGGEDGPGGGEGGGEDGGEGGGGGAQGEAEAGGSVPSPSGPSAAASAASRRDPSVRIGVGRASFSRGGGAGTATRDAAAMPLRKPSSARTPEEEEALEAAAAELRTKALQMTAINGKQAAAIESQEWKNAEAREQVQFLKESSYEASHELSRAEMR